MSVEARVVAQAKVNLILRVLAREASGYHAIETLFLRLAHGDEIVVRASERSHERTLRCDGPAIPSNGLGPVERNLAYRAAVAYADTTGWPSGFAIEIVKEIPVGGGLGGGSADAGAVLRALDALSPNPLGPRLVELATPLGADVPFLSIDSPMALAWGRGERLFPVAAPPARPVALVVPAFGVATAEAYGWVSSSRGEYRPRGAVLNPSDLATWEAIAEVAANDFEPVVAARHPEIRMAVEGLQRSGAILAMMSGSGSACFGIFDEPPKGAEVMVPEGCKVLMTQTAERVVPVESAE